MPAPEVDSQGRRLESQREASVAGVILAGTHHWTGSSFEELKPRPLLPVAETPLIDYVLGWLREGGVADATICANGSTASMRAALKDGQGRGVSVQYLEDLSPRGAAGCVKDAAARSQAQTFVVADGSSIPVLDLRALLDNHHSSGAALTIVAQRRDTASAGGAQLQPADIYVFDREVLDLVPATSFQDIKESLIPTLYKQGLKINLFQVDEISPRVLNADTYLTANHWMIARLSENCATELIAHPTASIDPGAMIIGPVVLGPWVKVLPGAAILGPTSIGAGTMIGAGAVVSRSVVWSNCVIGEGAVVDNSLLTDDARVAPGTSVVAAIRLKQKVAKARVRSLFARRKPHTPRPDALAKPALS
jgi:NDP-sugar pyrophosphorylase family protein